MEYSTIAQKMSERGVRVALDTFLSLLKEPKRETVIKNFMRDSVFTPRMSRVDSQLGVLPTMIPFINKLGTHIKKETGVTYLEVSYPHMDLAVTAVMGDIPVWKEALLNERDVHFATAEYVLNKKDITRAERDVMKLYNFFACYARLSSDEEISFRRPHQNKELWETQLKMHPYIITSDVYKELRNYKVFCKESLIDFKPVHTLKGTELHFTEGGSLGGTYNKGMLLSRSEIVRDMIIRATEAGMDVVVPLPNGFIVRIDHDTVSRTFNPATRLKEVLRDILPSHAMDYFKLLIEGCE